MGIQTKKPSGQPAKLPDWCKDWVTLKEAALILERAGVADMTLNKIRQLEKNNNLPFQSQRFGRLIYVVRPELDRYIEQLDFVPTFRQSQPAKPYDMTPFCSTAEAFQQIQAAGLPFSFSAFRYNLTAGRLPLTPHRFGFRYYVERSQLAEYIKAQKIAPL